MDKHQLMDLKETELKSKNQKKAFYRYLQIAEHHIFTENKKMEFFNKSAIRNCQWFKSNRDQT